MSIPLQPCQPFIPPTSLPWPQRLCPHGALLPGTLLPQRPTTPALLDTLLLGEAFSALSPAASQGLAQTRCLDVLLRVCQYRGLGTTITLPPVLRAGGRGAPPSTCQSSCTSSPTPTSHLSLTRPQESLPSLPQGVRLNIWHKELPYGSSAPQFIVI